MSGTTLPLLRFACALSLLFCATAASAADPVDIDAYIRRDRVSDIKLSPNGEYYATTVQLEDRTALKILRRADRKVTGTFQLGEHTHVADFWWVSPTRVVLTIAMKFGSKAEPSATGELFAIDADGAKPAFLVGPRKQEGPWWAQGPNTEMVWAELVDTLPNDDQHVIIAVQPLESDAYSRAEKLDVATGSRIKLVDSPVRNATFATDLAGQVRFAAGSGKDNVGKLYYRDASPDAAWKLINDENTTGLREYALGFAADGKRAYLLAYQAEGPDAIVAYDITSGTRTQVLRARNVDPDDIVYRPTGEPIGAVFLEGLPETRYFDESIPEAKLHRALAAAFGNTPVRIPSRTDDGRLALVLQATDRLPGDFFLFDTQAKRADAVAARREWLDPKQMATVTPFELKARDGLVLHGYLTKPVGADKHLPMVVIPHGGPFGVRDRWGFDNEAQLLAKAGYAVLQVNFRGSGGYGIQFQRAGAREWGRAMQDDVTDATQWAIDQGHADAGRICIYGASYGGYSALMGAAREPKLYRCAVGYAGVYDLPSMDAYGDTRSSASGRTYIREWIGEDDAQLKAVSPVNLADKIIVPVFLAAGGRDQRAPIGQSTAMEKALRKAGVPVETLFIKNEGHGFYLEDSQRRFYAQLLDFLARNLGGATAKAGGGAGDAKSAK